MNLSAIIDLVLPSAARSATNVADDPHRSLRIVMIVAACLLVYSNSLFADFVYDDIFQVVENRWLRDLRHLPEVFARGVWGFSGSDQSNYYRPLMHLSYMLTYALFGLRPWAFHLVNILLHAGASVLVFLVGVQLHRAARSTPPHEIPFLAALLFATHPIHTEAVTWIAGFPEVSFSLLFLLSLYLYIRAAADDGRPRAALHLSSWLCFFLALLSKETALVLPVVLLIYERAFSRGDRPFLLQLKRVFPYLAVVVVYLTIRTLVLEGFAVSKRHSELSNYEYFINVFPLVSGYLWKLLLPTNLNVFYTFEPIHSLLRVKGIVSLAVAGGFAFLVIGSYQRHRLTFFSASLLIIPLLPVLYIPALGENTFTDRYLYLPSFGYVMLAASFIAWLAQKQPRARIALALLVLAVLASYATATLARNRVWSDDLRLWTDSVEKSPNSVMPHSELGIAYAARGETSKAIEQYRIALRMNPSFADGHTNLGLVYDEMGRLDEAIREHREALKLKPNSPAAHNNLGLALSKQGRWSEAIEEYRESLRLEPLSPGVHNNLGNAYQSMGRLDDAIGEYLEALRLRVDFPDTQINLGVAYAKKGMIDAAMEHFLLAEKLDPENPIVFHDLANVYAIKGLPEKAEEYRQKAKRLETESAR